MNTVKLPIARKEGLVIQEMPDEVLVYDLESDKAHCLNETAAFVWKSCDGKHSVEEIAELLEKNTGSVISDDLIWLAIDQLSEKNLLSADLPFKFENQTRREVIKKIGLAAVVALPIITSLVAPSNVLAATSCKCAQVSTPNSADCISQPACGNNNCNASGLCAN